jgi:Uma2 family endonuclease
MATMTTALLSIDEYLRTMYHPDCDFVDGELQERNVGESQHGELQMELGHWFGNHREEWRIRVFSGQRMRISNSVVRIPDVCVVPLDEPREAVRVPPPLLCIEILSPEDRISQTRKVLDDYLSMGVKHIWLLDPIERTAQTYTHEGLLNVHGDRLEIPGTPIYLPLPRIFAVLD